MKPVPVTLMNLVGVALPTLIPTLPLAATVVPVGGLLRALVQFVVLPRRITALGAAPPALTPPAALCPYYAP
jgi:hypothetical protein